MTGDTHFACCFCGETIRETKVDPGSLVYTPADGALGEKTSQQMYCHAQCLKSRLHASVPLYTLDLFEDANE